MSRFISAAARDIHEKVTRENDSESLLPFGVPFLDKVLGGILPTDLVLIGADTGCGKTELATEIALNACKQNKRVHFFALEAEENEIERRMKYRIIANEYYANSGKANISYQDWRLNKLPFLAEYEEAASKVVQSFHNLFTFYRDSEFTVGKLQEMITELKGDSDLILLDHVGYIDFEGSNENKAVSDIVKKLKDLTQDLEIPVVLISHLRKRPKSERSLVPDIDDFMGTSNLAKIATRVVLLGNGGLAYIDGSTFPVTYIQAVKNRLGGERKSIVGKTLYDTKRNCYIDKIRYGRLSEDGTEFLEFNVLDKPHWLD